MINRLREKNKVNSINVNVKTLIVFTIKIKIELLTFSTNFNKKYLKRTFI